jgi:hypothetical protein
LAIVALNKEVKAKQEKLDCSMVEVTVESDDELLPEVLIQIQNEISIEKPVLSCSNFKHKQRKISEKVKNNIELIDVLVKKQWTLKSISK